MIFINVCAWVFCDFCSGCCYCTAHIILIFYTFSGSGNFRSQQWQTKALRRWPKADHTVIDMEEDTLQLDVWTAAVAAVTAAGRCSICCCCSRAANAPFEEFVVVSELPRCQIFGGSADDELLGMPKSMLRLGSASPKLAGVKALGSAPVVMSIVSLASTLPMRIGGGMQVGISLPAPLLL